MKRFVSIDNDNSTNEVGIYIGNNNIRNELRIIDLTLKFDDRRKIIYEFAVITNAHSPFL